MNEGKKKDEKFYLESITETRQNFLSQHISFLYFLNALLAMSYIRCCFFYLLYFICHDLYELLDAIYISLVDRGVCFT